MKYFVAFLTLLVVVACSSAPPPAYQNKDLSVYERLSIFANNNPAYVCSEKYPPQSADELHVSRSEYKRTLGGSLKTPIELNHNWIAEKIKYPLRGGKVKEMLERYILEKGDWATKEQCQSLTTKEVHKRIVRERELKQAKLKEEQAKLKEEEAQANREMDAKKCKEEFGFEEGTESYSLCLMKQNEIRELDAIAKRNRPITINKAPEESKKKSNGGSTFCQVMPAGNLMHCW
tara:strand:- start:22 stop:720 length:699 start_codon:yes stop_codon:yes gene_type:complete